MVSTAKASQYLITPNHALYLLVVFVLGEQGWKNGPKSLVFSNYLESSIFRFL